MSRCKECGECKHENTTKIPTFYVGGLGLAKCDDCGAEVPAKWNSKPYPYANAGCYKFEKKKDKSYD